MKTFEFKDYDIVEEFSEIIKLINELPEDRAILLKHKFENLMFNLTLAIKHCSSLSKIRFVVDNKSEHKIMQKKILN